MNCVATGDNTCIFTGNPQVTFFKTCFKQYSHFNKVFRTLPYLGGLPGPNSGGNIIFELSKGSDLITNLSLNLHITIDISGVTDGSNNNRISFNAGDRNGGIGPLILSLFQSIILKIGSETVVELNEQMLITEFVRFYNYHERLFLQHACGDVYTGSCAGTLDNSGNGTNFNKHFFKLPLEPFFWFCQSKGLALPITALDCNSEKVRIEFKTRNKLPQIAYYPGDDDKAITNFSIFNAELISEEIILDCDEAIRFKNCSHTYFAQSYSDILKKELTSSSNNTNVTIPIHDYLSGHVSEIVFWYTDASYNICNHNYPGPRNTLITIIARQHYNSNVKIKVNHNCLAEAPLGEFLTYTQNFATFLSDSSGNCVSAPAIACYNFGALNTSFPTGTADFDCVDSATIEIPATIYNRIDLKKANQFNLYGRQWKVMRISGGKAHWC